jgi:hypothetical protein
MDQMPEAETLVNGRSEHAPQTPRRGRPKKPEIVDRHCTDNFDTVASRVAKLAPDLAAAARVRVRHWVDRDRSLGPMCSKVVGFFLEHYNREKGFDWHSLSAIAKDLDVGVRAVENAIHDLGKAGITLRDCCGAAKGGSRGSAWRWRTTVPALLEAATEVRGEWEAESSGKEPAQQCAKSPSEKAEELVQKTAKSPPGKGEEAVWISTKSPSEKAEEPVQKGGAESLEESLEVESLPPLPPHARRRRRDGGARERGKSNGDLDLDALIGELLNEPSWADVTRHLIEPVLRQRKLLAPDPRYTLEALAEWAAELPVSVLNAAAARVLETRYSAVESEHFVEAVRAVENGIGKPPRPGRPGANGASADGQFIISEREHPEAFAAWLAYHEALWREGKLNQTTFAKTHGCLRVSSLYPSSWTASASAAPAEMAIH